MIELVFLVIVIILFLMVISDPGEVCSRHLSEYFANNTFFDNAKQWIEDVKDSVKDGISTYTEKRKDTFSDNTNELILVKASWCPACSEYITSSEWNDIKNSIYKLTIYDVDTDTEEVAKLNVLYIPALFIKKNDGTIIKYEGSPYDKEKILNSIKPIETFGITGFGTGKRKIFIYYKFSSNFINSEEYKKIIDICNKKNYKIKDINLDNFVNSFYYNGFLAVSPYVILYDNNGKNFEFKNIDRNNSTDDIINKIN